MNVNLVMTTIDRLPDEPIQDGKLIYTADKPGHYYDAGGVRMHVNSIQFVNTLPDVGESNMLYVTVGEHSAGVHVWHGDTTPPNNGYYSFEYVEVDNTLTISGQAADAKVVGDKFKTQNENIEKIPSTVKTQLEDEYLEPKFKQTVSYDKMWILTSLQCGDSLPPAGNPGRLFFLKTGTAV